MKMRLKRLRRRSGHSYLEINLMPLIDVALNLLIIFMVATPMLQQENGIQVELPRGNVKETDDSINQNIVVHITKTGTIFISGVETVPEKVLEIIQQKAGKNTEKTVFVKADTGVAYGKVMELIDKIKHIGGVRYVALATSKTD